MMAGSGLGRSPEGALGPAGLDVVLEFLICWHLASGEEGRPRVMAALRRRAGGQVRANGGDDRARVWSWCTSVWLRGWLRAAGLPDEARAIERGDDDALGRARRSAREVAMRRAGSAALVSVVLGRARACAAVDAAGAAAVTCVGVDGDQACLALATARDAAHAALMDGVDIGRVVARLRRAALALVDDMSAGEVSDPEASGDSAGPSHPGPVDPSIGENQRATTGAIGRTDMPDVRLSLTGAPTSGTIVLGSRVRVRDAEGEHEHTMVTRVTDDAPPGCVSIGSPVGRALLGRRPGDQVRVQTPGGVRLLTVVDVHAAAVASSPGSAR